MYFSLCIPALYFVFCVCSNNSIEGEALLPIGRGRLSEYNPMCLCVQQTISRFEATAYNMSAQFGDFQKALNSSMASSRGYENWGENIGFKNVRQR